MNYFSIKQILLCVFILILSIFITKLLAVLREDKVRDTLQAEIKKALQRSCRDARDAFRPS